MMKLKIKLLVNNSLITHLILLMRDYNKLESHSLTLLVMLNLCEMKSTD